MRFGGLVAGLCLIGLFGSIEIGFADTSVKLPGNEVLNMHDFQSPPLDADAKVQAHSLKSIAVAPSPVLNDSAILTSSINFLQDKTGMKVFTPAQFMQAAAQSGATTSMPGEVLTEDEQNAALRKIGQALGADAVLVFSLQNRGIQTRSFLGLGMSTAASYTLTAKVISVHQDGIFWHQGMDYSVIWKSGGLLFPYAGTISTPNANPPEAVRVVVQRTLEQFISDAWNS